MNKDRQTRYSTLADYLDMIKFGAKEDSSASLKNAIEEALRSLEQKQRKTESLKTENTEASKKPSFANPFFVRDRYFHRSEWDCLVEKEKFLLPPSALKP